jgi:hypothetical protein
LASLFLGYGAVKGTFDSLQTRHIVVQQLIW